MSKKHEQQRRRVFRAQFALFLVAVPVLVWVMWNLAEGGNRSRVRVTIPEGFTRFEIAARMEKAGICSATTFLTAVTEPSVLDALNQAHSTRHESAEGYLFPDTYEFDRGTAAASVVRRMVNNFQARTQALFANAEQTSHPAKELGWNAHQILTLASIVETEAASANERAIIAGVFYNRLLSPEFKPKRLQADPTVRYGCEAHPDSSEACRAYTGPITRAMLNDADNRYNTYRHEGLPPGPIANPGLASIRAALAPDAHAFLYFVAKGGGKHAFSRTLEEHNQAVARFRR